MILLADPMPALPELIPLLAARRNLSAAEVAAAAAALASTDESDATKAAFLTALAAKEETAAEIAGFATAFRALAVNPGVEVWAPRAIDIVGTGGDHAGGFNISSLVVLVLVSAGVPVMKHGNRGVTSPTGSADLLAALGVDLMAPPEKIRRALDQLGFAFFFAPNYHPAFKHIAPVRKALAARGQRTVFNILGPLLNPGRPAHILLGVYARPLVDKLADALQALRQESGVVGHGVIDDDHGIDELT
ncbi:MAG: Anthranilate phosphoribosyltransferase, partial [Lacunisphaera sp.]|nr:Anthranilate phosphoribosyltransferase [Lacunisphaera sp.]